MANALEELCQLEESIDRASLALAFSGVSDADEAMARDLVYEILERIEAVADGDDG